MKRIFFVTALFASLCLLGNLNAQNKQVFTVTNLSGYSLTAVSISQHDANSWGPNLVTDKKTISNTEQFDFKTIIDATKCNYDIKFTTDEGVEYLMNNVSLCRGSALTLVIPTRQQK
jgi:hypothetical protein